MHRICIVGCLLVSLCLLATGCSGPANDHLAAEDIDELVVEMLPKLDDPDPRARLVAIRFLAGQGDKAKETLPRLKELAKDKDPAVREAATAAVKKLEAGPASP